MKYLKKLLLLIFDLIDEFYHQKRIQKFLNTEKIKLENFIDVGAFRGKYTDLILKMQKNCNILMIEPQNKYYLMLKEKYKNNDRVEIMKIGVSDKEALLKLKINRHEITSTFSEFNLENKYLNYKAILFDSNLKNMTKNVETVEVLSLDEIFEKKNLGNIDLVKIDTEGHEYEVLSGTKEYLKKINYILIEFHIDEIYKNYNSNKIHSFLEENDFVLKKKFNFPFTTWEDRLYKNSKLEN